MAIGIHVGIIAALVAGLSSAQLRKEMLDISASVDAKKVTAKALPPPPPRSGAPAADRRGPAAANRHRGPAAAGRCVPKAAPPPPPAVPADRTEGNSADAHDSALSADVPAPGRAGHHASGVRHRCEGKRRPICTVAKPAAPCGLTKRPLSLCERPLTHGSRRRRRASRCLAKPS